MPDNVNDPAFDPEKDRTQESGLAKKGTRAHPQSSHGFRAKIRLDRNGFEQDWGFTKARDKAYDLDGDIADMFVEKFQGHGFSAHKDAANGAILFRRGKDTVKYILTRLGSYKLAKDVAPGAADIIDYLEGFAGGYGGDPKRRAASQKEEQAITVASSELDADQEEVPLDDDIEAFLSGFDAALGA